MAKRALIIGVADLRPGSALRPQPSVAAIESLLRDLGGWTSTVLVGTSATREAILAQLEQLAAETTAGDDVLVYFFGHGGVIQFDEPTPLPKRPFFYIAAARPTPGNALTGVFDFELSSIARRVDRVCGNVTVILDCCHSANIVRSTIPRIPAPEWVVELLPSMSLADELLSEEGHPNIVRLAGASSLRSGFAVESSAGHLGYLTQGFVNVVREAELEIGRLSWDAVAHRVREHAINARRSEIQWVTLAGPRQRLVFSREEIDLPRSVSFVRGDEAGTGWLRAGLLQGVELDDIWEIAALRLRHDHTPVALNRARVVEIGLNRARVRLCDQGIDMPVDGSSARLVGARRRARVVLADGVPAANILEGSALLGHADAHESSVFAHVGPIDGGIEVSRSSVGSMPLTVRTGEPEAARELLEDWVRAERLERLVEHVRSPMAIEAPLTLSFGRLASIPDRQAAVRQPLALDGTAVVHVGDRLYFEMAHERPKPESWFVCVVEIGVAGRPMLVTTNEPDGVEIGRRQSICIGCRSGGIEVGWPAGISRERPRMVTMIFLASQRPLQLGHLVRHAGHNHHLSQMVPRRDTARTRGRGGGDWAREPVLSQKWGVQVLRYLLAPDRSDPEIPSV